MKIRLSHYEFDLTDRYSSGSVLNAGEAKALNVTRSERIRDKVARHLKSATPHGEVLTGEALESLREYVSRLDSGFQFNTHSRVKSKEGTLDAEIRELARVRTDEAMRSRNSTDPVIRAGLYEALLGDPRLEEEAALRLEARSEVMKNSLGEL